MDGACNTNLLMLILNPERERSFWVPEHVLDCNIKTSLKQVLWDFISLIWFYMRPYGNFMNMATTFRFP
jgi:hypothetical protein